MLGLRVEKGASGLVWKRDDQLPTLSTDCVTRRQLYSWIGELLGHYPIVGWLHTACGFLQRCTAREEIAWDQPVSVETCAKATDLLVLLCDKGDPAHGHWVVDQCKSDMTSLPIAAVHDCRPPKWMADFYVVD